MATDPILAVLDVSAVQGRCAARSNLLFDYWELTKPEINFLIAITAAAGFWLGSPAAPPHFPWMPFIHTLLGTVFVASGAATLNQLIELQYDAQMRRTARRPLASGRIARSHALWFGVLLSVLGVVYLAISTNILAATDAHSGPGWAPHDDRTLLVLRVTEEASADYSRLPIIY